MLFGKWHNFIPDDACDSKVSRTLAKFLYLYHCIACRLTASSKRSASCFRQENQFPHGELTQQAGGLDYGAGELDCGAGGLDYDAGN